MDKQRWLRVVLVLLAAVLLFSFFFPESFASCAEGEIPSEFAEIVPISTEEIKEFAETAARVAQWDEPPHVLYPLSGEMGITFAAVRDGNVYFFRYSPAPPYLEKWDVFEQAALGDAKISLSVQWPYLEIWSQAPFLALEQRLVLKMETDGATQIFRETADPTLEELVRIRRLIQEERFDEVEPLDDSVLLYPLSYPEYLGMAAYAVANAHTTALAHFRAGDPHNAAEIMKWGLTYYLFCYPSQRSRPDEAVDVEDSSTLTSGRLVDYYQPPVISVPLPRLALYLNDYAFFVAEMGNPVRAELYLKQVVELDPNRTVAYLNLGDVSWQLGKADAARSYYQEYQRLLGGQPPPGRVTERLR